MAGIVARTVDGEIVKGDVTGVLRMNTRKPGNDRIVVVKHGTMIDCARKNGLLAIVGKTGGNCGPSYMSSCWMLL